MKTILITGDRSGAGKTSITVAIAALLSRACTVQCFKVGMDYIDPSYLTAVTGRSCLNLDSFVQSEEEIREIFTHGCQGADIALIEGVRGLFEGAEPLTDTGSTASIAKLLTLPVILVIDARSITRSAAALLTGFSRFDPGVTISGVILNNVRGEEHIRKATIAIEHYCGVPVIGAIPRLDTPPLQMRHLGLVPFLEGAPDEEFKTQIDGMVESVGERIDLPRLLDLADERDIPLYTGDIFRPAEKTDITIGIARDEAFNFYYPDLYPVLTANGADIVFFSPIHDTLPPVDGIIIGGGYPEYFGKELEKNEKMRHAILQASRSGIPVYGECGGLMYLCNAIRFTRDWNGLHEGDRFQMCGVFPGESVIPARRVVRYVIGKSSAITPFGEDSFRGHAFHYSEVTLPPGSTYGFTLERGIGIDGFRDGVVTGNTLGSYTHLHPVSSRRMLARFCTACRMQKTRA